MSSRAFLLQHPGSTRAILSLDPTRFRVTTCRNRPTPGATLQLGSRHGEASTEARAEVSPGHTVAIVPARWGSTRLPGKPLYDVDGLPVVERVRRRALLAHGIDRVVVATDDARIAAVVRRHGGEVVLTGPAESGTHRVAAAAVHVPARHYLNVQCDQPHLDPAHLDVVVALLEAGAPVATLAAPFPASMDPTNRARVKVVCDETGRAIAFSRSAIDGPERDLLHVGIYGFHASALRRCTTLPPSDSERSEDLEQLRWLAAGVPIQVGRVTAASRSLDTPDDFRSLSPPSSTSRGSDA